MYLKTFNIFILLAFLYFLGIPLEQLIFGIQVEPIYGVDLSNHEILPILFFITLQAIIGFNLGLKFSQFRRVEFVKVGEVYDPDRSKNMAWLSVILLFISIIIFYREWIASINDYSSAYAQYYESSAYAFSKSLAYSFIGISLGLNLLEKNYIISILLFFLLFSLGVITYDKDPMIIGVIAIPAGLNLFGIKLPIKKTLLALAILFIILFGINTFSYFRANNDIVESAKIALENFSMSRLDMRGPYTSIVDKLSKPPEYHLGSTYFNEIASIIPKAIYRDRADTSAEIYAKSIISDWTSGKGLGFSPIAEAYMNFGPYFAFIHFFLFGLLWSYCWLFLRSISVTILGFNRAQFVCIYYSIGFYLLLLAFRGSSFGFFKSLIHIMIPFFLFNFLLNKVKLFTVR